MIPILFTLFSLALSCFLLFYVLTFFYSYTVDVTSSSVNSFRLVGLSLIVSNSKCSRIWPKFNFPVQTLLENMYLHRYMFTTKPKRYEQNLKACRSPGTYNENGNIHQQQRNRIYQNAQLKHFITVGIHNANTSLMNILAIRIRKECGRCSQSEYSPIL